MIYSSKCTTSCCLEIKRIRELKKKFVDLVGLSTWEEAQAQFPEFATEDKIKEKFISLSKDIQPLVEYRQKAMRYVGMSINDEITYHVGLKKPHKYLEVLILMVYI